MSDKPERLTELGHHPKTPLQAIRANCLECGGGSPNEVKNCPVTRCQSYPFRFGTNPWRKPATEAQRNASRKNARHLRGFRENLGPERNPSDPVRRDQ